MRISTRPKEDSTRFAAASTDSRLVTSQTSTSAFPPASAMLFATDSSAARVRPHSMVTAPNPASERAIAAPMPRPAPVTMATCPARKAVLSFGNPSMSPHQSSSMQSRGPHSALSVTAYFCILYNWLGRKMESCLPSEEDVLIIRPPGTKGHFASKPQFTSISRGLPGKRLGIPDKCGARAVQAECHKFSKNTLSRHY